LFTFYQNVDDRSIKKKLSIFQCLRNIRRLFKYLKNFLLVKEIHLKVTQWLLFDIRFKCVNNFADMLMHERMRVVHWKQTREAILASAFYSLFNKINIQTDSLIHMAFEHE